MSGKGSPKIIAVISYFLTDRKLKVSMLIILTLILGFLEMASVAAIMPVLHYCMEKLNVHTKTSAVPNSIINLLDNFSSHMGLTPLLLASLLLIGISVSIYFFKIYHAWISARFVTDLVRAQKINLFKRLEKSHYSYFVQEGASDTLHTLFKSTDSLGSASESLVRGTGDFIKVGFLLGMLFMLSIKLTAIMVLIGFLYMVLSRLIVKNIILPSNINMREHEKGQIRLITEFIEGIKTIRIFLNEKTWRHRYSFEAKEYAQNSCHNQIGFSVLTGMSTMVMGALIGGIGIIIGTFTSVLTLAPILGVFVIAGQRINGAISSGITFYSSALGHFPNVTAVYDLLHHSNLLKNTGYKKKKHENKWGTWDEINFIDVSFSYFKRNVNVIENFNLTIHRGETISFVGPSGGGKTTLINLFLKLYEPTNGDIFIGKNNVNDLQLPDYLGHISFVGQEPFLMEGSIFENIDFGLHAHKENIIEAAKQANAHDFIMDLDSGYETIVKAGGMNLSGGQSQRIAIARALLKKPDILVLDEPTSALDTVSEKLIQETLQKISGDTTVLIVAHRLGTIKHSDHIYFVNNGGVTEVTDIKGVEKFISQNDLDKKVTNV